MHPVLFHLGKLSVFTYGFFIAVGFILSIFLARKEAERAGVDGDLIMDLSFYIILAALIGSRLFYVVTAPEAFLANPLEIFKIWNGGLVFYGGFIFALATALGYIKFKKLKTWQVTDILATVLPLGQFFGRLGCFSAGCCFGKICDLPWAVTFRDPMSLAPTGIPLHPTQIYMALTNLTVFLIIWLTRKRKHYHGQIFCMYLVLEGGTRTWMETFRSDFRGSTFFQALSISQVIGLSMVVLGIVMMIVLGKNKANLSASHENLS
ncbi:MAG: prolipoprotein diacylglyceryl transferase [Proteobacteria bacterium]|nr:prolipoprotein diacylglyceryl transferase [Pseudomonadota bacterium]